MPAVPSSSKHESDSPEGSEAQDGDGKAAVKVACSRCRSLKAKCSGPIPGGDKCAKCLKAGKECVVEQHRRGRKVGTRLSDPTKALMRMKSAFEIITNSKATGSTQITIPEDLALVASSASSTRLVLPPSSAASPNAGPQAERSLPQPMTHYESHLSPPSAASGRPSYPSPLPFPGPTHHDQHTTLPRFQLPSPLPPGSVAPSSSSSGSSIPNYLLPRPDPPPPAFYLPPRLQPQHPAFLHPSSSLFAHAGQGRILPPLPPFPAQFKDLGPSSRSSPSLARLFSLKPPDDPDRVDNQNLDLWRQDPITLGYITEQSSRELFDLFFAWVNPRICMFDPAFHTHDYVRRRSQLLFAAILMVSLKFFPRGDPSARTKCLALARDQILRVLSDEGGNAIESVQALLLLVEYKEPTDEQAYVLLGMACRLAMDLDLGQTLPHLDEAANRNRLRTWFSAFNSDRRFAGCGQVSKPTIMPEDSTIRNSGNWHRSALATPYDPRLVGAVHKNRIMSRYDILLKSNTERADGPESTPLINLRDLFLSVQQELEEWSRYWTAEIRAQNPTGDVLQLQLNTEHGKLQIAHHWLYQAFRFPSLPWILTAEQWETERREALAACLGGSCRILKLMTTVPNASLSHSPDTTILFYSYATFFLHKMFRARLLEIQLFDSSYTTFIFDIIRAAAEKLEICTIDPSHTIALHAGLLRSLLTFTPRGSPASRPSPLSSVDHTIHLQSQQQQHQQPQPQHSSQPPPPTFNLSNNPKLIPRASQPPQPPPPQQQQHPQSQPPNGRTSLEGNRDYFPPPAPMDPLPMMGSMDHRYAPINANQYRPVSSDAGGGRATPTSAVRGLDQGGYAPSPKPGTYGGVAAGEGGVAVGGADGVGGEDWNELWMEGGVFDGMLGTASMSELDFAFFDFHPPD